MTSPAARRYPHPRSCDYERAYRLNVVIDVLLHHPAVSVHELDRALTGGGLPAHARTVAHLRDQARAITSTPATARTGWTLTEASQRLRMGRRRLRWIVAELGLPDPLPGPTRRWTESQWRHLLVRLGSERWRRLRVITLIRQSGGRPGPLPEPSGQDPMGAWWDPKVVLRAREAQTRSSRPVRA